MKIDFSKQPRLVQWNVPFQQVAKPSLDTLLAQAAQHVANGDVRSAHALLVKAVEGYPPDPRPYRELARLAEALGRYENALACHDQALALQASHAPTMLAKAQTLIQLAKWDDAKQVVCQVLNASDGNPEALVLLAGLEHQAGDRATAENHLRSVLRAQPAHAGALNALGKLQLASGDRLGALQSFELSTQSDPAQPEPWINLGVTLIATGAKREKALDCYRRALQLDPKQPDAHFNLGTALFAGKAYKIAAYHLQQAIAARPTHEQAYINLAVGLNAVMQFNPALQVCERGHKICGDTPALWASKAESLANLGRHLEAIDAAHKSISLGYPAADLCAQLAAWHRTLCNWTVEGSDANDWRNWIAEGLKVNPFTLLSIDDDPFVQKTAATQSVEAFQSLSSPPQPDRAVRIHTKLRVGYISPDFRSHPIMTILATVFEAHDRAAFEWYAFSLVAAPQDPAQIQAQATFDHFLDVSEWSDEEIVVQARELQIDVMVDLAGHTHGSRMSALAMRCAPVQVTYIGYPGTTATPNIDYLFGSPVVTPAGSESWMTEQPVQLPWLVPISPRRVSEHVWTRAEAGLPADAFVYCSFNNNYKFTPEMFSAWARILLQVPGSILWLYAKTPQVQASLRSEAQARGLNPDRLVFAGSVPMPDYLARMRLADLFLDTHPYNAHTTALDAVWVGLPVLTFTGSSFVSRMAAGVLSSIGMDDLIATSLQDYEARAVAIGLGLKPLAPLRQQLLNPATRATPPFDATAFARLLEAAYTAMHQRATAGEAPAPLRIDAQGRPTFGPFME